MATRFFSRPSVLASTKQSLTSIFSRSSSSFLITSQSLSTHSSPLLRLRPLVAVVNSFTHASRNSSFRGFATRQTSSSLSDPNPNFSNRPPKETILLDGCDFEHWLVVMEKPEGDPTRDDIIDSYIKTLAQVVGSEEEARMKIYSVSTRHYFAFGALVSEELSYKLKELPKVRWVLPDSYLDVKNKDYGGEPFINGQAVPYDPKYHEEWVRNNARANERNRRNDRPRNFDRSRNFERRREMQNSGGGPYNSGGAPNMRGMPQQQNNMGGMPPQNMGSMPPQNNMGGMPPQNMGGMPPQNNMGGMPPQNNMGGMPPQNMGGGMPPQNNMGGSPSMPPNNMGGPQNMHGMPPNNMGGMPPPSNMGGMHGNMGGPPPPNYTGGRVPNTAGDYPQGNFPAGGGMPYQSGPGPNQYNAYPPNTGGGNPYQNQNQNQNMPERNMPPTPNQNYQ